MRDHALGVEFWDQQMQKRIKSSSEVDPFSAEEYLKLVSHASSHLKTSNLTILPQHGVSVSRRVAASKSVSPKSCLMQKTIRFFKQR